MKSIFTLFFFICLSYCSIGQDSTITLSQFELFTSQPNRILKKEMRPIGSLGWKDIYAFKSTEVSSSTSQYAIRIGNFNNGDMPYFINPIAIYIDFADLDSVISVLDFYLAETKKPRPSTDIQLSYITSNDIEFSAYYDVSNGTWQYMIGKLYKNLRTYVRGSVTTFNSRRFPELVELLKEGRASRW